MYNLVYFKDGKKEEVILQNKGNLECLTMKEKLKLKNEYMGGIFIIKLSHI